MTLPATDHALRVEGVGLRIGAVRILTQVSLDVAAGSVVGLIGSNGSGKSSLLNVVSRYYHAQQGRTFVAEVDTSRLSPTRVARLGVGRSFQSVGRMEALTVREYLTLGLEAQWTSGLSRSLFGLPGSRSRERAAAETASDWARQGGIENFLEVPMRQCPYGVRKLADVLRAVIAGPRLALLDEPTSGVASEDRALIAEIIRRTQRGSSRGVLVVDHDIDFVAGISDELIALSAGEVISRGTPAEVIADDEVVRTFVGTSSRRTVGDRT